LGAAPVRVWERSSQKVTSRRWCSASIAQCPRSRSASLAGLAWAKPRLVTAETVTVVHHPGWSWRSRVLRVTWEDLGGVREPEVVDADGLEGPEQRTVNPLMVRTRYNFLCASSRPALRAGACGGRPRAGNDPTVTGEPSHLRTRPAMADTGKGTSYAEYADQGRPPGHYNVGRVRRLGH
jgi:hypothetical protein